MSRTPSEVADAVSEVFRGVFEQLAAWRTPIEQLLAASVGAVSAVGGGGPGAAGAGEVRPVTLDATVADLVLPRLEEADPMLVGAGFIADGEVVRGKGVHFAWWLGPLDDNPVLGSTDGPTRLDLSTRGYTEYLRDFRKLMNKHGYTAALYGHFGMGCIHCRITFDLTSKAGLKSYRSFAKEAAELVTSYGGSLSGEHGDGQSRAELLPIMFGKQIVNAFREYKNIWDPDWKMNPGKVVDPYPIDSNLRLGADYKPWEHASSAS